MDESEVSSQQTTTETTTEDTPSPTDLSSEPKGKARSERANKVMNQFLQGRTGSSRGAVSQPADTKEASHQATEKDAPTDSPKTITLTEDEYRQRVQREAQAETDRREAKRNREAQAKQTEQSELERIRQLRESPYEAAQREADEKEAKLTADRQAAALNRTVETVMTQYDRTILDPIFQALPAKLQKEVLDANAHLAGVESRAANAKGALAALEKHWKSEGAKEAEAKLRKDPVFRKELNADARDSYDEPETLAGARPTNSPTMNDFILSHGGRRNLPYRRAG